MAIGSVSAHISGEVKSVVSNSLLPHGLYSPWNSPGQNTGVDSLSILQGDLPDPEVKPGSLALQADSLPTELSSGPGGKRLSEIGHFSVQSGTIASIVTALCV